MELKSKNQREEIIEDLLQTTFAIRHKLMVAYTHKKTIIITPSQGFVLRFISENKNPNIKEIGQALNISSSAATQLVKGLLTKGYLIRQMSSQDRRVVSLFLSQKAKKLFKEFKEQRLKTMTKIFNSLDDAELIQYAGLNKKIAQNINNLC